MQHEQLLPTFLPIMMQQMDATIPSVVVHQVWAVARLGGRDVEFF